MFFLLINSYSYVVIVNSYSNIRGANIKKKSIRRTFKCHFFNNLRKLCVRKGAVCVHRKPAISLHRWKFRKCFSVWNSWFHGLKLKVSSGETTPSLQVPCRVSGFVLSSLNRTFR